MDEWLQIMQWIIATLLAAPGQPSDLGSRVYREEAPEFQTTPYVVVSLRDSRDMRVLGGKRIMGWYDTLIKVVHQQGNPASMHAIMSWVDANLDRATGTATGIRVLSCLRTGGAVNYPDNLQFEHLGYRYRIQAQQEP